MTNHPIPRASTLAAILARALPNATPYRIALAVDAMIVAAKAHRATGEARCNYNFTEAQEARQNKRLARMRVAAWAALGVAADAYIPDDLRGDAVVGWMREHMQGRIDLHFGGDPRGCCGQLIVTGMPGDGWGPGFAIYA